MLITVGQTTNFLVQYETTGPNPTLAMQRAQSLLTTCEADFARLLSLFGVPASAFGPSDYITSINDKRPMRGSAFEIGYSTQKDAMRVILDSWFDVTDPSLGNDAVRFLFVAEVAEILMDYRNGAKPTWNRLGSDGEGLSSLVGALFYPTAYYSLGIGPRINDWLGSADRNQPQLDWITLTEKSDTNEVSYGCAILFINYLHSQLNYDLGQIIQTDATTLEDRFTALTGAPGGYAQFTALLNHYYPVGNTPRIPTDNPFPLLEPNQRSLYFTQQVSPSAPSSNIATGQAQVILLGCRGERTYHYSLDKTPQKLVCSSKAIGFGRADFIWKINGVTISGPEGTINATAWVTTSNPNKPLDTTTNSATVSINYSVEFDVLSSQLTIALDAVVGHIDLAIELDASEKFASSEVTSTTEAITLDNETLQFEPSYYKDLLSCFANFMDHLPRKPPNFLWWRYLPDPPPDAIRTIRELQAIGHELTELSSVAPGQVQAVTQTLARGLNLSHGTVEALLGLTKAAGSGSLE
jgi:hypothetical protein